MHVLASRQALAARAFVFVIDASLCCRLLGRLDWDYTFPTPLCDPFASKVSYPLRRDTEILRPFLTLLFIKRDSEVT